MQLHSNPKPQSSALPSGPYPFGMVMQGRAFSIQTKYRYGFNGKELDADIGGDNYDFGARIYDSKSCIFYSIDPKLNDLPNYSPYHFGLNNGIRWIDVNGEYPGEPFDTEEEALFNFAKIYNYKSIQKNREYATNIYKYKDPITGEEKFSYTKPVKGSKEAAIPRLKIPSGATEVAGAHTHGKYLKGYANNIFSPNDMNRSESRDLPEYLVTPSGIIIKYDPKKSHPSVDFAKGILISTNAPSDPKDPKFANTNFVPSKREERKVHRLKRKEEQSKQIETEKENQRVLKDIVEIENT